MGKIKDLLLAGSILPSLVLGQSASIAGELPRKELLLAQTETPAPDEEEILRLKRQGVAPPKPAAAPKAKEPVVPPAVETAPKNSPLPTKPADPTAPLVKPSAPSVAPVAPAPQNAPSAVKPAVPSNSPVVPTAPGTSTTVKPPAPSSNALPVPAPAPQNAPAPVKPPVPSTNALPVPVPSPQNGPAAVKPVLPNDAVPVAPTTKQAPEVAKPAAPAQAPAAAPSNSPAAAKPALPSATAPSNPAPQNAPTAIKPAVPASNAPPVTPSPNAAPVAPAPQTAPGAAPAAGNTNAPAATSKSGGITPSAAAAIGVGAGLIGGFVAGAAVQQYSDVQSQRQQFNGDGFTLYREPGRTIIQQDDQYIIRHDETVRFREVDENVQTVRQDETLVTVLRRPDGDQIITVTDLNGRLLRRVRHLRDGRELVLIDNAYSGPERSYRDNIVVLALPALTIPQDRYVVDAESVPEDVLYETLLAPPVSALPRRYTLDEVRLSPDLRNHMRSVQLNTINFETASWTVATDQVDQLSNISKALLQAIKKNPSEVFMVEGYTDAVGSEVDNLSLSDRRAESVATLLTKNFAVPPENLTSQGYGKQFLKINTQEASRDNRRVVIRRITPLLNSTQAGK